MPNLSINVIESKLLQREIEHLQHLELSIMNIIPINERVNLLTLSLAFPSLFSIGKADFALPRSRSIKLINYAKHLLKYQDGRFGQHPQFRYYIFNHIMRDQALSTTRYICQRSNERLLTLNELKNMIERNPKGSFLRKLVR